MANLAIKGHTTRGKEVLEILEMLGGKNSFYYDGTSKELIYTIGSSSELDVCNINSPSVKDGYIVFTLEEFLEKFPYKVGDKVLLKGVVKTIKQVCWDNTENEVIYKLETNIRGFSEEYYVHHYDLQPYKKEIMEEIKIDIPKGYEFAGVDDDNQQVVFTKIQAQYPKTYEECCEILDILGNIGIEGYKNELLLSFQKLLICRNAYWKIAGEQMGLGKPWEPNWDDGNEEKYCIEVRNDNELCDITYLHAHRILAFPTMEMLDIFAENFKALIEECKELL